MTADTRYARTSDGTHVAYQVTGEGPVDLLVLRTWFSNLEHEWEEPVLAGIYRRLGSLGRVIRLDRRGTGLSDRLDPGFVPSLEHRIDDIRAVLDAARSERAILIGLAHGAALCALFAATYPERCVGLILWAPPGTTIGRFDQEAADAMRESIRARWGRREAAAETVRSAGPSRIGDEALVDWIMNDERITGSPQEAVVQWELVLGTNVLDILSSVHVPALIAWRTGSPSVGQEMARHLPNATSREFDGDDHMLIAGDWRTPLGAMEDFILGLDTATPDADRVLATVLFTDIVGSTRRAAEMGDRDWSGLLAKHHAIVRTQLARHRGREIDTAGDGFFAAFDSPARAIRCAAAVRDALDELGLTIRIGLHAGECERAGAGLRGVAVHVGARIGGAAAPREILVSSTVRDLVAGSGIAFEEAGTHDLKGIDQPWALWRVTSA